jgi:hypothetical protein
LTSFLQLPDFTKIINKKMKIGKNGKKNEEFKKSIVGSNDKQILSIVQVFNKKNYYYVFYYYYYYYCFNSILLVSFVLMLLINNNIIVYFLAYYLL